MMMVSHSGKAGVWLSFSMGHLGFRGSVPCMVQEFMSNAASAEGKEIVFLTFRRRESNAVVDLHSLSMLVGKFPNMMR